MMQFDLKTTQKITSGFKVPEDYFEHFESKLLRQVFNKKNTKRNKIVSLFYKKHVWMSSIAALLIIAIALPVYYNTAKENKLEAAIIELYLNEQNKIGTNELINHLTDDDFLALENTLRSASMNEATIEAYLSEVQNLEYLLNE